MPTPRALCVSVSALLGLSLAACGGSDFEDVFSSGTVTATTGTGAGGGGEATSTGATTASTTGATSSAATGAGGAGMGGMGSGAGEMGGMGGSVAGAGGGATATTSVTATTSTGPLGEDCLDGIDNDADGQVDCADPDCVPGFECTDAAPAGWTGYHRANLSAYPGQIPLDCPDSTQPTSYFAGPAGPAQCLACSCGAWGGASCAPGTFTCHPGSGSCGGVAQDFTSVLADGQCHKPNIGLNFLLSCAVTTPASVANAGACAPSPTGFGNTDPFAQVVDVCDAPAVGGGCAGGEVCVPKAGGAYLGGVCISQPGAAACPSTWPTPILAFAGASDDRDCTSCQCGVSGATCSAGKYTMYDANNCGSGGTKDIATSTCVDVSAELDFASWSMKATLPVVSGGTCAASGGTPVGSVQTQGAVTLCCQ